MQNLGRICLLTFPVGAFFCLLVTFVDGNKFPVTFVQGNGWSHPSDSSCPLQWEETLLSSILGDNTISSDWEVDDIAQNLGQADAWLVETYPMPAGKSPRDYAPPRDFSVKLDTVVLVPIPDRHLGSVLRQWIQGDISAHYLLTGTGPGTLKAIKWISPRYSAARLPCGGDGQGDRQLVIAVHTPGEENARLSRNQIEIIKEIVRYNGPSKSTNIAIRYLTSLAEILSHHQGGGGCDIPGHGNIDNIDEVRGRVCLSRP